MAGELPRPGVEVIQTFATPAPSFVRPTLVPVVVGPAFEVLNVLNSDGTINSGSKFGAYSQLPLQITESSFPNPRNNIAELVVQEGTVRSFMLAGGTLGELLMNPGEAFLTTAHGEGSPAIQTVVFNGGTGLALAGKVLVLSVDNPVRLNTVPDTTVTFTGSGNLSSAQAAAQINAAVGEAVATVVGTAPNDKVQIASTNYGATASITVRAGGSANAVLQIGYASSSSAHEERIEGSGWRGQNQNNSTTQSPWVEFYQGGYLLDGTDTTFPAKVGIYNIETPTSFTNAKHAAITFGTGGGQIPINVGDYFFADGARVQSAEISKVEAARFKLGTINTALSTADSNGRYITKVYNNALVGTIFDPNPFAPKYAYFKANGLDWTKVAPIHASITGGASGTAATAGVATGAAAGAGPFSLAGLTIHYISTIAGVDTEGTFTFTGGPFANMAAVEAAIGTHIPGVAVTDDGGSPPQIIFTTTGVGKTNAINIKADGTSNSVLGFSTSSDTVGTGVDTAFSGLTGKTLQLQFDKDPHIYVATFSTNSLDDAIVEINQDVGYTVASKDTTGLKLVITSYLAGMASAVNVIDPTVSGGATQSEIIFKLLSTSSPAPTTVAGSGRPFPDSYLDNASVLHVQADVLRDQVTGYPLDQQFNMGSLYIQYKALRQDVSPVATVAGVLRLSDVATLSTVLNPLTDDNPLGLGLFLCMLNAPNFEVKGLGVDTVSATAPFGTSDAWARAASMLEAEEVYAIAPLTQDDTVISLWLTHVGVMSSPEQGGERIVFFNKEMLTRAVPKVALSGTNANSTPNPNQMLLDGNPAPGLLTAGINPALPIPESAGVYMTFVVGGQTVNYNVSSVSGALVNFRTTFTDPSTNIDGFYTTAILNSVVLDASYSLDVRGASLNIPGSNPARLDYSLVANNTAEANSGYSNRRGYSVFPDTVNVVIAGVTKALPGFYACAAIAGMVGAQPPQQPFTNFPMTGITGVMGTEKFTKSQLNVMAGGGTYILIQDAPGGPVVCRHQLSTDLTSIETRELSITKDVDFVAKFLRLAVRKFIGKNVINNQLLDAIGTTIHAVLKFLEDAGVLNGSNLNNLLQDPNNPDTVLVDVTLDVPFPCNYIRLTLVV